jgi:hypothetical protein
MFQKLDEKGDLPALVHWALTLVRFNQAYYYLPAVVGLVSAVIAAEALLCVLCWARQERLGVLAWWLWVGCVGLFAWLLALAPPMLAHTMKSWGVVS